MVKHKIAFMVGGGAYAKLVQLKLQQTGFDVTCFPTEMDFTQDQRILSADLIILDHDPNEQINGLENLRTIKTINRDVPVLLLVAANDTKTATQALRFGAFFYIEKSILFTEQLYYAINQLDFNKKRTYDTLLRSFRKSIFRLYGFY